MFRRNYNVYCIITMFPVFSSVMVLLVRMFQKSERTTINLLIRFYLTIIYNSEYENRSFVFKIVNIKIYP